MRLKRKEIGESEMNKKIVAIIVVAFLVVSVGSIYAYNANELDHTTSISSDADPSNFYDWRDGLEEALGVKVTLLLDTDNENIGVITNGENLGLLLPGTPAGYEWEANIADQEIMEFIASGQEVNVVGEREIHQFTAFKALNEGSTEIIMNLVEKDSDKVESTYSFDITVTE